MKKIQITMSERRPLTIDPETWPTIAEAETWNGEHRFQANYITTIRVREHADGRRIVYGKHDAGPGGVPANWHGYRAAGFLIDAVDGRPDDDETVRAVRRVGGIVESDRLASECIATLPAEEL